MHRNNHNNSGNANRLPGPAGRAPQAGGTGEISKCSHCGRMYRREDTTVFPFCSVRCQQIDLGRWLNEEVGLPVNEGEEELPSGDATP